MRVWVCNIPHIAESHTCSHPDPLLTRQELSDLAVGEDGETVIVAQTCERQGLPAVLLGARPSDTDGVVPAGRGAGGVLLEREGL